MTPSLPPKEVRCACGEPIMMEQPSRWCRKCGRQVFYDPKDQRNNRIKKMYFTVLIAVTIGFVAYLFVEMIFIPMMNIAP